MLFQRGVLFQGKTEIFGNGILGDIVGGRSQTAGGDDGVRLGVCVVQRFQNAFAAVRNLQRELRNDAVSQEPFPDER